MAGQLWPGTERDDRFLPIRFLEPFVRAQPSRDYGTGIRCRCALLAQQPSVVDWIEDQDEAVYRD